MTFDEFVEREALLAITGKNSDIVVMRFVELREAAASGKLETPDDAAQYSLLQAIMTSRWRWKYASDQAQHKTLARTAS